MKIEEKKKRVYIAGPEVFLPDAIEIGRRKKALCADYGFIGLFPADSEVKVARTGERLDHEIYRANVEMVRRAHIGICNLTPYRGVSADAGTVFELGMLVGLNKRVFGYSHKVEDLLTRVEAFRAVVKGSPLDESRYQMRIEEFENVDNLMIDSCLALQGHPILTMEVPCDQLFRSLSGFEACLRQARDEEDQAERMRKQHKAGVV